MSSPLLPVTKDSRSGYINTKGDVVIPLHFQFALGFSEGLAFVNYQGQKSFIDGMGQIAFVPKHQIFGYAFKEGLCSVEFGTKSRQTSFIDKHGNLAFEQTFDWAANFAGGLAAVQFANQWGFRQTGFIGRDGSMLIPADYDWCHSFEPGEEITSFQLNAKWGLLDRSNHILVGPVYEYAGSFANGLAPVKIGDEWGAVNKNGDVVVQPAFEEAGQCFAEGRLEVSRDGKWGFIDQRGDEVSEFDFTYAKGYAEGLAAVYIGGGALDRSLQGGKYGFIDAAGELVISPQFADVGNFVNGVCEVFVGDIQNSTGKRGYIDRTGQFIWEPTE